jgi:hypothetical protein
MQVKFRGVEPVGQAAYSSVQRQSQLLNIVVVEPPMAGRPSGYRLGDVGQFRISASVEPREVKAHEAVAVNFELSGMGNLPQHIDLPEQKGLEWLEPNTNETIERKGGKISGKRLWQYVLKLHEPGTLNLGAVRLPYWDPERGQYAFAAAELGQVVVRPGAPVAQAGSPDAEDNFSASLLPREQLAFVPPPRQYWADLRYFWALLLVGPLGVVASFGCRIAGMKGLMLMSQRRDSIRRRTMEQLSLAKVLLSSGDSAGAASALERALLMAIEAATGLRARGIIRDALVVKLTRVGLTSSDAEKILHALDACDAVRFTGGSSNVLVEPLELADPLVEDLCRRAARAENKRRS